MFLLHSPSYFLRQTLTERSSLLRLDYLSSKPQGSTCLGLGWDYRHTACTRFYMSVGDPDETLQACTAKLHPWEPSPQL